MAEKKVKEKTKKVKEENSKTSGKRQEISPINRFNILFVDLQIVFTVLTIICLVWYLFNAKVWYVLQVVLGITMIIIGYNNKIIYKKPKTSYIYYIIGAVLIIFDILALLGV